MIRLDKRTRRTKIIAGIVALAVLATIGVVVWYVDKRSKQAEAERRAKLAEIQVPTLSDEGGPRYAVVQDTGEEPRKRTLRELVTKTHRERRAPEGLPGAPPVALAGPSSEARTGTARPCRRGARGVSGGGRTPQGGD